MTLKTNFKSTKFKNKLNDITEVVLKLVVKINFDESMNSFVLNPRNQNSLEN